MDSLLLDRVDRTYEMHHKWTGQDFGTKLPSDVFREHFLICFISDPIGVQLRHQIGIDNIAWECDYPHSDSSWPHAPEELADVATGVPDDEVQKITWENECRWYSFDPLPIGPGSSAQCAPCELRRSDMTCPSTRTIRVVSSERAPAPTWAPWPPRQRPNRHTRGASSGRSRPSNSMAFPRAKRFTISGAC